MSIVVTSGVGAPGPAGPPGPPGPAGPPGPPGPGYLSPCHILEVAKCNRAFTSVVTALAAAVAGDTVLVWPGVYAESFDLKNGVQLYLMDGVVLTNNPATFYTVRVNATVAASIDGDGVITCDGVVGNRPVEGLSGISPVVSIRCKRIDGSLGVKGMEIFDGTWRVICDDIVSGGTGVDIDSTSGTNVLIRANITAAAIGIISQTASVVKLYGNVHATGVLPAVSVDNDSVFEMWGDITGDNGEGFVCGTTQKATVHGNITAHDFALDCSSSGVILVEGNLTGTSNSNVIDISDVCVATVHGKVTGDGINSTDGRLTVVGDVDFTGFNAAIAVDASGFVAIYGNIIGAVFADNGGNFYIAGDITTIGTRQQTLSLFGIGTNRTVVGNVTGNSVTNMNVVNSRGGRCTIVGDVNGNSGDHSGTVISVDGGSDLTLRGNVFSNNNATAINVGVGTFKFSGHLVAISHTANVVQVTGGATVELAGEVDTDGSEYASGASAVEIDDGQTRMLGLHIETRTSGINPKVILKTGGVLILQSVSIVDLAGGGTCVGGTAAQPVVVERAYANVAVQVGIVQQVENIVVDANVT